MIYIPLFLGQMVKLVQPMLSLGFFAHGVHQSVAATDTGTATAVFTARSYAHGLYKYYAMVLWLVCAKTLSYNVGAAQQTLHNSF